MKVYNYHPKTKLFWFEEDADPDPIVPGRWLIPANATTVRPTRYASEGEVLLFNEDEQIWNIMEAKEPEVPYYVLRAREYPSIFDYIDGVVKNDHEQINKYIKACQEVKDKYPKSTEI